MSKKLDLGNSKLTFGEANGEAMFPAEMEDLLEVVPTGGKILAKEENIIHLDKTEGQQGRGPSFFEKCS